MRQTDIVIAGGGLAGSTAAAMLGRAGHGVVLVDPHAVYPPDFRAEKIDGAQAAILRSTGSPTRCCAPRPSTASSGWRASAAWSRSARATSTASCTTRWSTPCARKFPA